jgi:hypothetical protein
MSLVTKKALLLSTLVLGIGGFTVSAEATARQCASAECACERALAQNTVEALETFLKEYRHDASSKDTACAALGVPLDGEDLESPDSGYQSSAVQPDGLPEE